MYALYVINREREARGASTFALYPLRRHMAPGFVHMDERALDQVLQAMRNEREGRRRREGGTEALTFANVFDARGAGIVQTWRLKHCVDTDGVSLHFKQLRGTAAEVQRARDDHVEKYARRALARKRKRDGTEADEERERDDTQPPRREQRRAVPTDVTLRSLPRRGIWCIDALKALSRDEYTVVGVDPGVHELVHASRFENPERQTHHARYTLRERRKDMRVAQYAKEAREGKPDAVVMGEQQLCRFNSRASTLAGFLEYCTCRRSFLDASLAFYGTADHRHRRRKSGIKRHQSESKLVGRLAALQTDRKKPIVLAYGSWGLTSSRPFKGVPPSKGVGLMRHLAKHFVVVPTPEHFTSKLCPSCGGLCDAHPSLRRRVKKRRADCSVVDAYHEIRGLRVCQNEDCKLHLNRDRMAAHNIATNYARLARDEPPLRAHSADDAELNRLQCAMCSEE